MPLYYPAQGGRGSISSNTNYPPQSIKSVIIPFPNGWLYRSICTTIASEVTGATHTDYPLYVTIQDDLIKSVTETDGRDILFTDINNVTIPFLIEVFDRPAGIIKAWLKRTINNSTNVLTWLYIGNENATDAQQRTAVWDSNFKAVYLMADGNLSPLGILKDETASPLNGTVVGATGLQTEAGLVGNAEQMGAATFSFATITASAKTSVTTNFTIEYIAKKGGIPTASPCIFNKGSTNTQYTVYYNLGNQPAINIVFTSGAPLLKPFNSSATTFGDGANHYNALTYDGANVTWHIDGVADTPVPETRTMVSSSAVAEIGAATNGAIPWGPNNPIDLIRISNIARSEDFITTSNNNFFNPTVFTTKTPFVTSSIPENWFNESYKSRVLITIKSGQVPTTQTDFPFLFNSTLAALVGKVQSAGQDIRWVLPDKTELKYELQEIDSGTGKLITWTKIPSISNGTTFYLYFNNPTASPGQDTANVWDSNYKGVWHLSQTPAGANSLLDSTSNANHASPTGSPSQVSGQIGNCLTFDGIVDFLTLLNNSNSLDVTGEITVGGWVETSDETGGIIDNYQADNQGWRLINFSDSYFFSVITTAFLQVSFAKPSNGFHRVIGVRRADNFIRLNIDGVDVTGLSHPGTIIYGGTPETQIAKSTPGVGFLDSKIADQRIQSTGRSADYLLTEFKNQSTPASFYEIGAVEEIT